jgi:ketopantoate reductase
MNDRTAYTHLAKAAQLRRMERDHLAGEVVRLSKAMNEAPTANVANMYARELRNVDDKIKAFDRG